MHVEYPGDGGAAVLREPQPPGEPELSPATRTRRSPPGPCSERVQQFPEYNTLKRFKLSPSIYYTAVMTDEKLSFAH